MASCPPLRQKLINKPNGIRYYRKSSYLHTSIGLITSINSNVLLVCSPAILYTFHSQQSDDKTGKKFIEMLTGKEMIAVSHFHLLNTELDTLGVSNKLVGVCCTHNKF